MRYRLQYKERVMLNNLIGNVVYPTPTYRWKDIAITDNKEAITEALEKLKNSYGKQYNIDYRIEDTLVLQS